ncbi:Hypothetical protein NTJ_05403 [Nesidiocoris tenuis]|uniref:Uncharacterized protein n=1 Tax=Nesidiocoris tenuis TaxID=355587 RepID=A0ABN7AMX5_9HEMI|nr:Hypothetical protein NTJ_05403 [Nesidiocoris tenuis]
MQIGRESPKSPGRTETCNAFRSLRGRRRPSPSEAEPNVYGRKRIDYKGNQPSTGTDGLGGDQGLELEAAEELESDLFTGRRTQWFYCLSSSSHRQFVWQSSPYFILGLSSRLHTPPLKISTSTHFSTSLLRFDFTVFTSR